MAAKELETTTVELADGRYELRASRDADAVRRLLAGLHRGPRRRRRGRRGRAARLPALAEGDVTTVDDVDADPALHRAAAALHRGDADQGARGARHRPAVDLRRDDLDDRRPRLRPGRGAAAPPGAGRRDRHRPARRALRRLRRPRVHGADGGGARRGRPRRARVGAAAARVLRPAARPRRREATRAQARGLHDRADRRGLLARATRWSSGSAATAGSWPARCTRSTRSRGRCPARSRRPRRATARSARSAARARSSASAAGSGRSSAARAIPDCKYIKKDGPPPPDPLPFEVACPKNNDGHLVARRARRTGNVFWGCSQLPEVRLHDERRAARRAPRRGRRPGRAQGRRRRSASCAGRPAMPLPDDDRRRASGYPGGPPNPAALARPARGAAAGGGAPAAAAQDAAAAARPGATGHGGRTRVATRRARPSRPPTRERGSSAATATEPGPRRGSSGRSPRATPRRTPSGPTRRPSAPTSPGWPRAASTGGRPARATCGPTSRVLGDGPRALVRRAAARRDPLVPPLRDARRPRAGRPVGRDRDAAPAARLPRVLEVDEVERLLAVVDADLTTPRPAPTRTAPRSAGARAARPGDRRDRLRGRPADQRAGRRRPRLARPAPRRDPGPGQGPQGADRAARAAGPRGARRPTSRTAGRSCSQRRADAARRCRRPRSS